MDFMMLPLLQAMEAMAMPQFQAEKSVCPNMAIKINDGNQEARPGASQRPGSATGSATSASQRTGRCKGKGKVPVDASSGCLDSSRVDERADSDARTSGAEQEVLRQHPFPFQKRSFNVPESKVAAKLQKLARVVACMGNDEIPSIIGRYLSSKDELRTNHEGHFVFVSRQIIVPTGKNHVDVAEDKPAGSGFGMFFKVGSELESSGEAFMASNGKFFAPVLPLSFGRKSDPKMWFNQSAVLADTGCNQTTFDFSLLLHLLKSEYRDEYAAVVRGLRVVGGIVVVLVGRMEITFCGQHFPSLLIRYADLPHVAVIGRDLLSKGRLLSDGANTRLLVNKPS